MPGGVHELSFDARGYSRVVDVSGLENATLVVSGDFVAVLELSMLSMIGANTAAMRVGTITAPGCLRIPAEATAVRVGLAYHERGRPLVTIVGRPSSSRDT